MSQWVDFRVLKQTVGIEQVLASYRVDLQRTGPHQWRGRCPLPTHGSERSRQSFSVDTSRNVWACHWVSCCAVRQGRVGQPALLACPGEHLVIGRRPEVGRVVVDLRQFKLGDGAHVRRCYASVYTFCSPLAVST